MHDQYGDERELEEVRDTVLEMPCDACGDTWHMITDRTAPGYQFGLHSCGDVLCDTAVKIAREVILKATDEQLLAMSARDARGQLETRLCRLAAVERKLRVLAVVQGGVR